MTADDAGGHETVFAPLASVWARVIPLSGRAMREADGRGVAISHAVVIRYRADLVPGDRIVHRGRTLDVVTADDLNGRRAYLSCVCTETALVG